jgi:tetratricopeptide (TPR) repeat protein
MADTLEIVGSLEEAEGRQTLERLPASTLPAEVALSFQEGLELLNHGEAAEAAPCFEWALERAPQFADGHVALGIAYAVQAKVYPALDHLELATKLEPENFYAHFKLGQLFFKLRVPQRGYEAMSRALDCASNLAERRLVAQLLREEKQREKTAYRRPWWNKPFSQVALVAGTSLMLALIAVLFAHLH